jgi:hypothetical protein
VASYNADINLNIVGASRLNTVVASVAKLNALAQDLKPINLVAPGGGNLGNKIREAIKPINDFAREVTNGTKRISNTFAGASQQADVFRTVLDNVKVAAGGFSRQTAPVKLYATALTEAQTQVRRLSAAQQDLLRTSKGLQLQDERNIETSRRFTRVLELRRQQTQGAALAKRGRESASNALIGGAFPLLFGQGAGAAVGGGLGGALGGAFGGTLGFGLSLVGTAIGQAIDDARKLDTELNSLNNNLSSTGSTSRTTASDISQLASQLGIAKDEALKLVNAFSEFGSADVREALAASFGAAGGEAAFDALAAAIDNKSTLEAIVKLRDTITDTQAKEALKQLELNGAAAANAFLQERLIQLQEQKLIKIAEEVTLMDRILAAAAALGAQGQFIDPAIFGQERADEIRKRAAERKKAQTQALQDTRKFLSEVARLNEQYSTKTRTRTGPKPPEDRTSSLQADLQAIIEIGNAEDLIRDLRFDGRDLLVADVELAKALADIERDRVKQLERANYETERNTINQIAQARAFNEERKAADQIREIEKQRAEKYASVLRSVEYEIQLTDARIDGTERQVTIEQKIADLKREQSHLTNADVEKYRELLELTYQRLDAEELVNIERQISATGAGLRAGFIGQAGAAFEQQLAAGKSVERATEVAELTNQLQLAQVQAQALESSVLAIGQAFGTAMTTGVSELINGTKTAQQVFAEFLQSVGSALLDAAAQMIATYVAIGIARAFAGFAGGGGNPAGSGGGITDSLPGIRQYAGGFGGGGAPGSIPFAAPRAMGGPVTSGAPYVIGERGPELFVPGTGGSVVNNNDLRSAMGAAPGSSGGPVLNMSFETTSIGGTEYVSREQLEQAMAATRRQAASDGAKRGMSMTLDRIQQSPQTRNRLGIR